MKYLVEIIPESIADKDLAVSNLAAALKIDHAKAASLLKRNPVTKPVSQAEAEKVAKLFTKAGIEVFVRAEVEELIDDTPSSEPTETSAQRLEPPQPKPLRTETAQSLKNLQDASSIVAPPVAPTSNLTTTSSDALPTPRATDPGLRNTSSHASAAEASPEMEHPDAFQARSIQGEETLKIPSGFFTPVPDGAVTSHSEFSSPDLPVTETMTPPKSSSGIGNIAFASIVPGLLALAGILTALYLLGLPFLQAQQRTSAETAAVSLASSIGGWIGDVSLDNPALSQQVQNVVARSQGELRERGVDLLLLTDNEGNQLAGWYKDAPNVPDTIVTTDSVRTQISNAVGGAVAVTTDTPLGEGNPNIRLTVDGETLGLASAAVRQGNTPVGSVVVGASEQRLMTSVRPLLPTLLLAGVLPLLLGILLSLLISRNRS
jgi:hypothetical protein